ncbi:MAG TPA: Pycsar system effector family protein [Bryobacteraceae bacterium]
MSGPASSPMGEPAPPPAPDLEQFLWHVHGNLAEQIKFADQKSGFVAVLSTGVMGGLHSVKVHEAFTQHPISEWGWSGYAGAIAFGLLAFSLLACFASITPRRRSNQRLGFIFWGGIAEHETEQAFYEGLLATSTEDLTAHLSFQTYGLARICKEKYSWLSWAIGAAVAGSELGGVLLLFSAIAGS